MLEVVDAVESWVVLLPLPFQILLLLAVFLPLCWLVARAVDPLVEWVLRPHTQRSRRREENGR